MLFYILLIICQGIVSQDSVENNENIFETNSSDSLQFSIPESLVIELITDPPQFQETTITNDVKKLGTGNESDTIQSFDIEDTQNFTEDQQNDLPDTSSFEKNGRTEYKADIPDDTTDPDTIIIVEDEDTTDFIKTDNEKRGRLDIFVDHSQGMIVPRFKISPKNIAAKGKLSYMFDFGIFVPFLDLFYGGLSLKYSKLSLSLSESFVISSPPQSIHTRIDTKEYLTSISVPFECGMRFKFNNFIPYFYIDIGPSFLTGANQCAVKNTHFIFDNNGPQKLVEEHIDLNVRNKRKTLQLFFGGGIGLEIVYSYGSLFADIGCQYALLNTVIDKDNKSIPYRTSDGLVYFPISFGLRFYL